jgi:hypothetical protein
MTDQNTKDLGTGPGSKTVAIDFDGVIHSYTSGWTGPVPEDWPVKGAGVALKAYLNAGFEVAVYSTRAETPEGLQAIVNYIRANYGRDLVEHERFRVTAGKPMAVLYIDDRAFSFRGRFPTPEEVAAFRPWKVGETEEPEQQTVKIEIKISTDRNPDVLAKLFARDIREAAEKLRG